MRHWLCALVVALTSVTDLSHARTPVRPRPPPRPATAKAVKHKPSAKPVKTGERSALLQRFGIANAQRLLSSNDARERERGLARLGSVGTPRAIELLSKALEPGGAARSGRERLVAVRALARRSDAAAARLALVRAMAGVSHGDERIDPHLAIARRTAAMALALAGDAESLSLLGQALRQEGPASDAAGQALLAHPPRDLTPVLKARGAPTRALAETLGRLGDQRAFHALRAFVRQGSPEVRAAAAVALTRLGDLETIAVAKRWAKQEQDVTLSIAAAEILTMTRDPLASNATLALIGRAETRREGLELAARAPSPALEAELAAALGNDPDEQSLIAAALGRSGGPDAAKALSAALERPAVAAGAAYALATCPSGRCRDVLERALVAPKARRLAARAGVVRHAVLDDAPSGLADALELLRASTDPADRWVGAWGLSTLSPDVAAVTSTDPVVASAVAQHGWHDALSIAAAKRLARERDPRLAVALASCLSHDAARQHVPTRKLIELLDDGGGAAPLAALALAARDGSDVRPRLDLLAASSDPLLRAHVALGLGHSKDPSALSRLEHVLLDDEDPRVRQAAVTGLSIRPEVVRRRALLQAASLDPDADVQSSARLALAGHRLSPRPEGKGVLWLSLSSSIAGQPKPSHTPVVATATGLAVSAVPPPDGLVVLTALPEGPMELRLAPAAQRDQAPSR